MVFRFGGTTAKELLKCMEFQDKLNGHCDSLWITRHGTGLESYAVETIFSKLRKKTGIAVHPHLLRDNFATLWLKNGGDSQVVFTNGQY